MDYLEDGDAFAEISGAGSRQTIDDEFVSFGSKLPRVNRTGPGSPVNGPPIRKLADERWPDHLEPDVARDLIRRGQGGDEIAKAQFYRAHHNALVGIAGNPKYRGAPFEHVLSAATEGFNEAFAGYNLGSNNGFWAYAIKFIKGRICECITDWSQRGIKNESDAARKDRSKHRPINVQYNGVEGSHYDVEGSEPISACIGGWIAADDSQEFREWDDNATAQRISQRLANIGRSLRVSRECIGVDENPHRNGGRRPTKSRFEIPRAESRCDNPLPLHEYLKENPTPAKYKINAPTRGNAPPLGIIEFLAKGAGERAKRRLAEVGRRLYAAELAAKDRSEIGHLAHSFCGLGFAEDNAGTKHKLPDPQRYVYTAPPVKIYGQSTLSSVEQTERIEIEQVQLPKISRRVYGRRDSIPTPKHQGSKKSAA